MAEVDYIMNRKRLTYEGLFDARELFKLMDQFFFHLGYDKIEKKHTESVLPEGKHVETSVEYYRKVSSYVQNRVKFRVILSDVKEVEVKQEGKKTRMNKGKVQFVIDAMIETDWEGLWENKPVYYVIRTIVNKWIVTPMTSGFKSELGQHVTQFTNEMKAFLNLYRY